MRLSRFLVFSLRRLENIWGLRIRLGWSHSEKFSHCFINAVSTVILNGKNTMGTFVATLKLGRLQVL